MIGKYFINLKEEFDLKKLLLLRIAFNSLDELNLLIKTQPQFVVFDFKSPFEAYLYLSRMPYQFYNDLVLQTQQILDETKVTQIFFQSHAIFNFRNFI